MHMLIDARSQNIAFIDPFGSGFLQDIIKAIKDFYNKSKPGYGNLDSGLGDCKLGETHGTVAYAYGRYGYRTNGCNIRARMR